ncbi:MAG: hypothetical protein KDC95_18480 [Planctomycetes bacterium]|nr:hypothetical protein [Planctomycetota bacterium]
MHIRIYFLLLCAALFCFAPSSVRAQIDEETTLSIVHDGDPNSLMYWSDNNDPMKFNVDLRILPWPGVNKVVHVDFDMTVLAGEYSRVSLAETIAQRIRTQLMNAGVIPARANELVEAAGAAVLVGNTPSHLQPNGGGTPDIPIVQGTNGDEHPKLEQFIDGPDGK